MLYDVQANISSVITISNSNIYTITMTNTKSLAKEFSKILTFEYFGYVTVLIGFDVFFDADSESPRMT